MRKKKVKIPIFHGEILMIQTENYEYIEKNYAAKGYSLFGYDGAVMEQVADNGYVRYIVWFDEGVTHKVVVHEALHLLHHIFKHRGIEYSMENDEHAAYMLEWIFEQCDNFLFSNK